jgi:hypothetical protein
MATEAPKAVQRLNEAIEQLHRDVQKVEIWAGAITGFAQPVPEYSPSDEFLLPVQDGPNDRK